MNLSNKLVIVQRFVELFTIMFNITIAVIVILL